MRRAVRALVSSPGRLVIRLGRTSSLSQGTLPQATVASLRATRAPYRTRTLYLAARRAYRIKKPRTVPGLSSLRYAGRRSVPRSNRGAAPVEAVDQRGRNGLVPVVEP